MNNEEFYGVLKLVSGEELFAKVSPCEEEYRTILILESPVTFETIPMKNQAHGAVRIVPWVKMCNETSFVVNMDKVITVTEVRMSPDLKTAKAFVLPLGGKNATEAVNILKEFSFVVRKVLSKKITMKFLPKILFVKDDSFEYAEKIENLIKQTNK